jgi:hypothetical protein
MRRFLPGRKKCPNVASQTSTHSRQMNWFLTLVIFSFELPAGNGKCRMISPVVGSSAPIDTL